MKLCKIFVITAFLAGGCNKKTTTPESEGKLPKKTLIQINVETNHYNTNFIVKDETTNNILFNYNTEKGIRAVMLFNTVIKNNIIDTISASIGIVFNTNEYDKYSIITETNASDSAKFINRTENKKPYNKIIITQAGYDLYNNTQAGATIIKNQFIINQ